MKRITKLSLAALCAALPLSGLAADNWLPLRDTSLLVAPGGILDFSALAPARSAAAARLLVTPDGHFAPQGDQGAPQRFLMASLGFGVATGSFPNHTLADLYVQQARLRGYNMVRLEFVEDMLMHGRRGDFNFDPEQLDRFYYLLAALRKEGMYVVINGLSSDNGAYGDQADRGPDVHHAKLRVFYDAEAQAHWKKLIRLMLGANNPYTGASPLSDASLAGVILVNEGGLEYVTRNGAPDELRTVFSAWLKKKYGSNAALAQAWGGELAGGESVDAGNVALPKISAASGARMADAQRFFVDLQQDAVHWMQAYLAELGYHGLVTGYDNWISPAAQAARSQFDWIDMHEYFSLPSGFSAPGSSIGQDSMLAGGAKYITELAASRQLGKAYTVSEYGQVFWNRYRRESALAVPAYAALQGWDMIAQHSYDIVLSYGDTGNRKDKIYPFVVGTDPIGRATETLAALLFRRGDVAPARHRIGFKMDAPYVFEHSSFYGNLPGDFARLALVTGIGLDDQGRSTFRYDAQLAPGTNALKTAQGNTVTVDPGVMSKAGALATELAGRLGQKIDKSSVLVNQRYAARVEALRKAGLLDPANQTDPARGLYQSDTGQILLDSAQRRLSVVTPLTEAVVFDAPAPLKLSSLQVLEADGPALVSVSSMDEQPLRNSQRMLVILATDARNSGMRFADAAETTIADFGGRPVVLLARSVKLHLASSHAAQLKVYSANLRGQRMDSIPVTRDADGISFVLDTAKLSHGPTTYFEITTQD